MRMFYFIIMFVSFSMIIDARPFRVTQYPHGSSFQCAGCHINQGGGGEKNVFGQDVEKHLVGGNVNWGPELAALDSDGDGFTNGEELLDPEGKWNTGEPNPGDSQDVTAPFDADDFPTGVNNIADKFIDFEFNSSNVFNETVSFSVHSELSDNFTIRIYNSAGSLVDMVYKGEISSASFDWKGNNTFGGSVPGGLYYIAIQSDKYTLFKKILKL